MSDILRIEEIDSQFVSEWVLIENPDTDSTGRVLGGRVAFHSPQRDEVYRQATQSPSKRVAFHFTGELPERVAL